MGEFSLFSGSSGNGDSSSTLSSNLDKRERHLVWCHERCHKSEQEELRASLASTVKQAGDGRLHCLKKSSGFESWLIRMEAVAWSFVLLADWREVKPCVETLTRRGVGRPHNVVLVTEQHKQYRTALRWAEQLPAEGYPHRVHVLPPSYTESQMMDYVFQVLVQDQDMFEERCDYHPRKVGRRWAGFRRRPELNRYDKCAELNQYGDNYPWHWGYQEGAYLPENSDYMQGWSQAPSPYPHVNHMDYPHGGFGMIAPGDFVAPKVEFIQHQVQAPVRSLLLENFPMVAQATREEVQCVLWMSQPESYEE